MSIPPILPFFTGIEIRNDPARQGLGVFAIAAFKAGDRIGFFAGAETDVRSRMSLQFGEALFVEPGAGDPLRNLNHSCDPSARFSGRELYAARALRPGEAVTIDYNLHEDALAAPFDCACGGAGCVGEVRGWRFLNAAQKRARASAAGKWLTASVP